MLGSSDVTSKNIKIILVEDDDGDAIAIRRAFSKAKIMSPLLRFENGSEALAFLKGETEAAPPRKFIILSDINMPKMTGIELLAALRSDPILRRTVFFILTTSDDERDISAAYFNNVAGYILKSHSENTFVELMSAMDHYWNFVELPTIESREHHHG